jgi:hypothetical protein
MPINLLSGHAKKQRPRPDFSAVVSKRHNLYGSIANDSGTISSRDKLIQSHAGDSRPEVGCPSRKAAS